MSTSLAEQLQRLTVPQTSNLIRDKKKASFLFDPKVAAGLSKETVYELALEGYEELLNRNAIFAPFQKTLFHASSKQFERSVQTAKANDSLNVVIKRFLLLLSPYFLSHGAHATLEWLIHRYEIHQYNKEELLMLILPYHETNYFVRALQIIKIKPNDKWCWLKPLQKPGVHLPKSTLYNHASSDPFLIQTISNHVLYAIKEHDKPSNLAVIFNFYATVFVGALQYGGEVHDAMLSQMLPAVMKGLKSEHKELCAPTYIILSKLIHKNQFSAKLLDRFVEKISKNTINLMHKEQVLLLVLIYHSQLSYKQMPEEAVRDLANKGFVGQHLGELKEVGCAIQEFLVVLFGGAFKLALLDAEKDCRLFVEDLLNKLKLNDDFVPTLIDVILDQYKLDKKYSQETSIWIKNIIHKIEQQNPVAFDTAVAQLSQKSNNLEKIEKQKRFHKIVQDIDVLNRVEIFEKLHHPSKDIRIASVQALIEKYPKLREAEKSYVQNTLMDRLNDEENRVVHEVLIAGGNILTEIIQVDDLITILINIVERCSNSDGYYKLCASAIELLAKIAPENDLCAFETILPFLLSTSAQDLEVVQIITQSRLMQTNSLLKALSTKITQDIAFEKLFKLIYASIQNKYGFQIKPMLNNVLKTNHKSAVHDYVRLLMLVNNAQAATNDERLLIFYIIKAHIDKNTTRLIKGDATVENYIRVAKQNVNALNAYLHCLEQLFATNANKFNANLDLYEETSENEFYLQIIALLLKTRKRKNEAPFIKTFNKLIYMKDATKCVELLLNVANTESRFINNEVKLNLILKAIGLIQDKDAFLGFNCTLLPQILVALQNADQEIRKACFNLLDLFVNAKSGFAPLLNALQAHKLEIIMDESRLCVAMAEIMAHNNAQAILSVLLQFLGCNLICLKCGVVNALKLINNREVYMKLSLLGGEILGGMRKRMNCRESLMLQSIINQLSEEIASNCVQTDAIWSFLQLVIKDDTSAIEVDGVVICPSILLMERIDRGILDVMVPEMQDAMMDAIVGVVASTGNPEVTGAAGKVFKHLDLDAGSVQRQLVAMRDVVSPKVDERKPKRRRASVLPTVDILDTLAWKKGIVVLEFIQDKKKIKNVDKIVPTLFEVLKKCLDFDEQSNVEYPKQLILSSILHCCNKLGDIKLPERVFNMELVVQCIRASQNPQTHHHALLLLARSTQFTPTQVLHHIMAIFTFMGSSVLRHDDAYSFQIIAKIIDTIIPILVQDGNEESVRKVLRVFVDVIMDVPEHRRIPLYLQLIKQIGAKDNLHTFMLLVFEAQVLHTNPDQNATKRSDILNKLCHEFNPSTLISTCSQLLEYVRQLPENKEDCDDDFIFDLKHNTPKQFRHYKYTIILFVSKLMQSHEFVRKIAELNDEETLGLEDAFKEMIIHILTYIQSTSKVAENNAHGPQGQYWKVVLHHSYDILDGLNALLTPQMFLLVIKGLMTHTLPTVRRRAIELLNAKLQNNAEFFETLQDLELFAMIPPLIDIIKQIDDLNEDNIVIIQTAFLSLKLFVKLLAIKNPEKFVKILNYITDLVYTNKCENVNILASAILCLAELSHKLRAHAIPTLNKFMHSLIKLLKNAKQQNAPDLLLMSVLTAIQKIFDSLSLFLSPYLQKLLCELSHLSTTWDFNEADTKLAPFLTKLVSIKEKIGTTIPPRILIPAIDASYKQLIEKNQYKSVNALMEILREHLKHFPINEHINELTTFFLDALQFRANKNTSIEQINSVEAETIKALLNLTLKLSESTFRPLYYKLYDWAIRSDVKNERIITFYGASAGISKSLKGLFVLFAGHIINNMAQVLESCNLNKGELYFTVEKNNILLLENVLHTLNGIFSCDAQKFINKDRFDLLMQPIVDQLDNTLGNDYEMRVKSLVIPCIVNFAVATADDALWKQLNYQILLKMRDINPTIRLLGLECLTEFARKIGEDFLPLLPETIPFLAELLEDEEELVEKASQRAVQDLEKVLGEPLQKYF